MELELVQPRLKPVKPLGIKGYGSTPHLVGSRVGPADHSLTAEQSALFTGGRPARRGDLFYVTEKIDGSCVVVAKHEGHILAISRAGYLASDSPWELHHHFARWVELRAAKFDAMLSDGERLAGEWLHTAMGTRYHIVDPDKLFMAFAIFEGRKRVPFLDLAARCDEFGQPRASVISAGPQLSIPAALEKIGETGFHGALDGTEGAVWVHEHKGQFTSIAKFVRHDKVDGKHLATVTGGAEVLNYFGPAF